MRSRLATAAVAVAVAVAGLAPAARAAADPPTYTIDPHVTDPAIVDTVPQTRGPDLAWLPAASSRPAGKLLVFLPSGGATNLPTEFKSVGAEGARLGYHTIVLAYRNEVGINAPPPAGCGPDVEPPATPASCAFNVHMELLDGRGESSVITVDRANSIENRLTRFLQYLAAANPTEGWGQYLDSSGAEPAPKWSQTVIAGQSLGSGESVLIGMVHLVSRVALFAGFTDAKHGWVAPGLTPVDRYYALIHQRDNFFGRACYAYVALNLAQTCPLPGFADVDPANPLLIDNRPPPFGTHQLVFGLAPDPHPPAVVADPFHSSTARDGWIAKEADGSPSHVLLNGWRSILGDSDADTRLDETDNCVSIPNTDQLDSDRDGIGDPCDPVTTGGVGGSVPATLSLTLGSPAGFGPFAPGVDNAYDATTTATVVSTALDGALAVSDPAAATAGHLVNGTFALAEPLQVKASSAGGTGGALAPLGASPLSLLSYAGPASNDAVTIAFHQHIGATQALRTGSYSKTLTFSLSTTTP